MSLAGGAQRSQACVARGAPSVESLLALERAVTLAARSGVGLGVQPSVVGVVDHRDGEPDPPSVRTPARISPSAVNRVIWVSSVTRP